MMYKTSSYFCSEYPEKIIAWHTEWHCIFTHDLYLNDNQKETTKTFRTHTDERGVGEFDTHKTVSNLSHKIV